MLETAHRSQEFGIAIAFILVVLIIGNLVLLNLFLAIMGASFQSAREVIQVQYSDQLKQLVDRTPVEKTAETLGMLRKSKDNTQDIVDEAEKLNTAVKKSLHSKNTLVKKNGIFCIWYLISSKCIFI